jgi:hypothetical protein
MELYSTGTGMIRGEINKNKNVTNQEERSTEMIELLFISNKKIARLCTTCVSIGFLT